MLMSYIAGWLLTLLVYYFIVKRFNAYVEKKYNVKCIGVLDIVLGVVAVLGVYFGYVWHINALKDGGDALNGIILAGMGIALSFWIFIRKVYLYKKCGIICFVLICAGSFLVLPLAVLLFAAGAAGNRDCDDCY